MKHHRTTITFRFPGDTSPREVTVRDAAVGRVSRSIVKNGGTIIGQQVT
jgi:hypothetical protein